MTAKFYKNLFSVVAIAAIAAIVSLSVPAATAKPKQNPCVWYSMPTGGRLSSPRDSGVSLACTNDTCVICTKKTNASVDCRRFNPVSCLP